MVDTGVVGGQNVRMYDCPVAMWVTRARWSWLSRTVETAHHRAHGQSWAHGGGLCALYEVHSTTLASTTPLRKATAGRRRYEKVSACLCAVHGRLTPGQSDGVTGARHHLPNGPG